MDGSLFHLGDFWTLLIFTFLFIWFALGLQEAPKLSIEILPQMFLVVIVIKTLLRVLGTVKNNAGIGINVVVVHGEFVSRNLFHSFVFLVNQHNCITELHQTFILSWSGLHPMSWWRSYELVTVVVLLPPCGQWWHETPLTFSHHLLRSHLWGHQDKSLQHVRRQ